MINTKYKYLQSLYFLLLPGVILSLNDSTENWHLVLVDWVQNTHNIITGLGSVIPLHLSWINFLCFIQEFIELVSTIFFQNRAAIFAVSSLLIEVLLPNKHERELLRHSWDQSSSTVGATSMNCEECNFNLNWVEKH